MKNEIIIPLLSLFIVSCGVEQQFSEYYKNRPAVVRSEENSDVRSFSVPIFPLSESVGDISGSVDITINQTDVSTTTQLTDVPQSLMLGKGSIRSLTCNELAATFRPVDILNNTTEFKDLSFIDNGSRESLIAELNRVDQHNGDSVNLVGKSYVIEAYINNIDTTDSRRISLFPIACGSIQDQIQ